MLKSSRSSSIPHYFRIHIESVNYKEGVVITATELKQNLGKYLNFVEQQNDVVITKNGSKIARLTPYVTDIEQYFITRENALDYQYGGKKVSYKEFMEISEKSILRMEFINGEIHLLASPDIRHQEILARLYLTFNDYFKGQHILRRGYIQDLSWNPFVPYQIPSGSFGSIPEGRPRDTTSRSTLSPKIRKRKIAG